MDLKICRICGENEGTSYIFTDNQYQELGVSAKITYCCTRVAVSEGDGLPAHVCLNCEEEVRLAYQFVLKCEATDQRLRSYLISNNSDTLRLPDRDQKECKSKVEIKFEIKCVSDPDDDISDNYISSEHVKKVEVKQEKNARKKVKTFKKKVKYLKTGRYKCSTCSHESTTSSALTVHMRLHTGETPFPCPSCEKKYKDQGSLKRHMDRNHYEGERERKFVCENCGKAFYSKNDVKIHMRTHTGETPYPCDECPMKFTQIGALIRHKKRHAGDKPYTCSTCGKCFCTKEELKYHSRVHSDEKNYCCSVCKVLFKYKNNLTKHMTSHSAPHRYVCNYCGRTFNQKGNLKGHIDRQHSAKSGYCNVCSKSVPNVEAHMWKHTGQRPLKCDYCSCSFFDLKTLARHVNYRHKNTDKFKCSFEGCGMKFPARSMLEFHTAKVHKTGIPYPCDRCTRGFYRKNDLARHKIATHKEKLLTP